jgi:hypothetical protein
MNSKLKAEEGILSVVAFACYACAMASCGAAAYALVVLSLQTYGNLELGFYLTASQF